MNKSNYRDSDTENKTEGERVITKYSSKNMMAFMLWFQLGGYALSSPKRT